MKRLLLLARHYPPAISGGARRPFLLAQELRNQGVDVRVCAPSVPPGEPGWPCPHPHRDPPTTSGPPAFSLRAVARDLLLWPDPDIRWSLRAAAHAAQAARAENWQPDWVLSTSPPESIHVAGRKLASGLGARWAADFRDLWLENPHRHERRRPHRRIGERIQARRLLPKADLVLAVDPTVAAEARSLGARAAHVLPHFAPSITADPAKLPHDCINIVHAGSISLSDPDADIASIIHPFEAARKTNQKLHLHFVGRLTAAETEIIASSTAASEITVHGPVTYDDALSYMAAADALAFVASAKMHVPPSKIVEYLMFNVPIIATGDGPWRNDPRTPAGDPIQTLAELTAGKTGNVHEPPPRANDVAAQLLALLT